MARRLAWPGRPFPARGSVMFSFKPPKATFKSYLLPQVSGGGGGGGSRQPLLPPRGVRTSRGSVGKLLESRPGHGAISGLLLRRRRRRGWQAGRQDAQQQVLCMHAQLQTSHLRPLQAPGLASWT